MSRLARQCSAYRLEPSERADGHSRPGNPERDAAPRGAGVHVPLHPGHGRSATRTKSQTDELLDRAQGESSRNLPPLRLPDRPSWLELSWPTSAAHGSEYLLTH